MLGLFAFLLLALVTGLLVTIWSAQRAERTSPTATQFVSAVAASVVATLLWQFGAAAVGEAPSRFEVDARGHPDPTTSVAHTWAGLTLGILNPRPAGESGPVRVDVQEEEKGWGYGRIYDHYGKWGGSYCGWVAMDRLSRTGPSFPALWKPCPDPDKVLTPERLFAPDTYAFGDSCTRRCRFPSMVIACDDQNAYGNYDPATRSLRSPYGPIPVGRGTTGRPDLAVHLQASHGQRNFGEWYRSKDGQAVLIVDPRSVDPRDPRSNSPLPGAYFMRARCVHRLAGEPIAELP
jgi:hypothetical protein